jgi:hypothetical protein
MMPSDLKESEYTASGDEPPKEVKNAEIEITAARDATHDQAVEDTAAFADYRERAKQLIKAFRDSALRLEAHRRREVHAFREASDRIERTENVWSAISDRELTASSCDERERARKARNKRDQRARKAKPVTPAPAIAPVVITREGFKNRLTRLKAWLALPGPRQRQLRGREADIMRSWIVYQDHVARHGRRPSLTQFAGALTARSKQPTTRPMAQNRLKLLGHLMAAGGSLR